MIYPTQSESISLIKTHFILFHATIIHLSPSNCHSLFPLIFDFGVTYPSLASVPVSNDTVIATESGYYAAAELKICQHEKKWLIEEEEKEETEWGVKEEPPPQKKEKPKIKTSKKHFICHWRVCLFGKILEKEKASVEMGKFDYILLIKSSSFFSFLLSSTKKNSKT